MDREIGSAKTWQLLRHLLDPEKTKSEARQQLQKLVYKYEGQTTELLTEVRDRYLCCAESQKLPDYAGSENPDLDSPITVGEVRAEINRLKTKTAAGPDKINNRMLRNLDDGSIRQLAAYMQECWDKGEIPQAWKTANVVFIPKPGKKLSLEHLRLIYTTSCVGKLMEHVIQTRLTRFMEDEKPVP
uniref:Putative tick transposon n=1 Tax=Rhipicephalus microplus TaxID=6941 RepID=A0A6G5ACP0_RHIMP